MAMPSATGLRPSPSLPSLATPAAKGLPTKKLKRTSFPDWGDGPSPKRTSMAPIPAQESTNVSSLVGSGRLAASRAVQAAQRQWEEQAQAAADVPLRPLLEDSGSEYFTSGSPASADGDEEGSGSESMGPFKGSDSARRQSEGTNLMSPPNRANKENIAQSVRDSRPPHSALKASQSPATITPVPLPPSVAQFRASSHVPATHYQTDVSDEDELTLVTTDVIPKQSSASTDAAPRAHKAETKASNQQGKTTNVWKPYLTGKELEARIRGAGIDPNDVEKQRNEIVRKFENRVGPNGELYTTADGRLYSEFKMPDGGSYHPGTTPLPTGYKLHTDASLPFICPVRNCRKVGAAPSFLMGHFSASHNKTTFNDNLDGTLTAVGTYNKGAGQPSPGIVVSRNPLPADAPPCAQPAISLYQQQQMAKKRPKKNSPARRDDSGSRPRRPTVIPAAPAFEQALGMVKQVATEPIKYLRTITNPSQEVPQRADILELMNYPWRRPLPEPWIAYHARHNLSDAHYACAVAYIVGEEVREPPLKCSTPRWATSRLSDACIQLPSDLTEEARHAFSHVKCCVGCKYWSVLQRRANSCSWGRESQRQEASEVERDSMDLDSADTVTTDSPEESPEPPVRAPQARSPGRAELRRNAQHTKDGRASQRTRDTGPRYSKAFSSGDIGDAAEAHLEMEDWEFAPGRMLNKRRPPENVAFSNSYLTSREPVPVSEDISFNIVVLKAGTTFHFEADEMRLRTCSVATGKVKVKVNDTEFKIGPHGMFKVMPGESCVVENRSYIDSYIHCTTVDHYELGV